MAKVIWVVPKNPIPAFDGARMATTALLSGLTAAGLAIELVVINSEAQEEDAPAVVSATGVSSVTFAKPAGSRRLSSLPARMQSVLLSLRKPLLGLTLQRYASDELRKVVANIARKEDVSYIVFDGLHTAAAFAGWSGTFEQVQLPVIYRAHNREFRIWERKATSCGSMLAQLFFRVQAVLVKRFEDSLVQSAEVTCTVSKDDIEDFRLDCPAEQYVEVPIGNDFSKPPKKVENTHRVFFVGRLDWQPNVEGLKWFLDSVWPEAKKRNPQLELDVVGSGNSSWLKEYADLEGVHLHGRVESLETFYSNAAICLIPVFFGSGTRVKAIEASRYGRPCLSTAIGVEGLPLEAGSQYIRAETVDEWVQALAALNKEKLDAIGVAANAKLAKIYDKNACSQVFFNALFPRLNGEQRPSAAGV